MRVSKPSPAMLVALLAVFIALGGTSYSAITLSKNSVKSGHIVNGQVKRPDIAKAAVTSRKVKDYALLAKDFKQGQLPAGPPGPTGQTGPTGPAGPSGARGPSDAYIATEDSGSHDFLDPFVHSADPVLILPAGVYALFARAEAESPRSTSSSFLCSLFHQLPSPESHDSDLVEVPAGASVRIRLQALVQFDVETAVQASCSYGYYEPGVSDEPPLHGSVTVWAIRIENLHLQPPVSAP